MTFMCSHLDGLHDTQVGSLGQAGAHLGDLDVNNISQLALN